MSVITHIKADLFTTPATGSILIHACNTVGSWGAGIAVAFREHFPDAFVVYKQQCKSHSKEELLGTCLLIPGERYDVACLFTSKAYGKSKSKPEQILASTRLAVQDLLRQNTAGKELHSCRINSGKFGVPWEDTEAILQEIGANMTVYEPVVPPT
ncbi:hypothetical protein BDZ89DRAFT_1082429 [Hymenopellis radicata]|nr:hypothetical protein BDZ89DRAFT_1082429 [Hymenopellis radicata]